METRDTSTSASWKSRATTEARGDIREVEGKRVQVRYNEEPFALFKGNFETWPTYAYTDRRKFPPPSKVSIPAVKGDPRKGRELFLSRAIGPCTGCHLIPGDDVWPAGDPPSAERLAFLELAVNLKTARALGITIPSPLKALG